MVVLEHLQNQAKTRSGNSANKDRKNLVAAWNWGVKFMQLLRVNPFMEVDKFASNRHGRPVPTLEEFWKVYEVAETEQDKANAVYLFADRGSSR